MTRKLGIIVLGLAVRGWFTQPLFAQQVSQVFEKTETEQVALAPGGTIRLDDSYGELNVEGWSQPDVEITVIRSLPYDSRQSASEKELGRVQITSERKSDKEVIISTKIQARHGGILPSSRTRTDVWVKYFIHAPRDARIVIHHEKGSVHVNNMAADVDADSGSGDMVVMIPDPDSRLVDAKTKVGLVVSDFGAPRRAHFVGESLVTGRSSTAPVIHLRMGYGGITVKTLPSEAYTADQ